MASEAPSITAPEPVYRTPWQRWVGFWFPAADPTTLGFIRVTTGLLVLYIHIAYSIDLQQFFGKHGWYAAAYIERERHEYPWQVSPFWSWDPESVVPAKVPEFPHRRKAVVDFIRALPAEEAKRKASLEFLRRVSDSDNPEIPVLALNWFQDMRTFPERRDRYLAALVSGQVPAAQPDQPPTPAPPAFFAALPAAERERVANDVRAFWDVLPARDTGARAYVLNHFVELGPELRRALVHFLYTLPNDPAEREKKIEYLDYWNNEADKALRTGHKVFSVWFHVTDPTQMALIHACALLAILLFTIGLFTRVTSVLTWIAVVCYIHRSQQILFGMDTMMNILLFYLMVGNSGAALSVDRLVARYRAARAGLARSGGTLPPATRAFLDAPPPSRSAGLALRLIQVHFCFIYVAAGLSKLKGGAWWDGRALWDVVVNPEFTLMQYEWYEKALRAGASIKPLYYAVTVLGVWGTLFIEVAGPFLLWTRLRWLIILLATAMHAFIAVLMGLNLFELLMIIMLVAFLPDQVIRDRLRGGPALPRLKLAFAPGSAAATRAAALTVAVDAENQVALVPDPGAAAPVLTDSQGTRTTGPHGVGALFRSLRLLAPLSFVLWVPGVRGGLARRLFPSPAAAPQPAAPTAAS
ncbi:hypothetical protein GobsT_67830 [Gemmata obscuriglobus]|uniref:HTTM domain-containing protein n=1 Tax=Gemmata obscuriglobus TaxID=114 RepID=UPI00016C50F1|nr:HTTM domain-containing protein [Gemmata obscuriglobus]QEG31935.1 hypothetical protein GobsT_67830 [Gemmata obscuriglobus]VTS11285.1 httm domain protein : Thiol-disulfide oxidoreductase DCC OS=Isosphaera pallida (strain ATCC 43644 / DSM 9630 / IS1B) GN=Isop_3458 PE=4 SV=1: VKG_Carbox [Gemmata obscuriglobus UQM 2246]